MNLTERFNEAMQFALAVHSGQLRKGTDVPYASHLLAVASIVLEYGGDEDLAIAALLHDSIEDRGIDEGEIRRRFGDDVAGIVTGCSDSFVKDPTKKLPWATRKKGYLRHLETASDSVLLVSMADKLHNIRSILKDFREIGDAIWGRFNASKGETLWFYSSMLEIFQKRGRHKELLGEFSRTVANLQTLAEARQSNNTHRD